MENRVPVDKATLIKHLVTQLDLMLDGCASFDAGKSYHAQVLATNLRVILHHTKKSKSLLHQLKLEHIPFIDTASKFRENDLVPFNGLTLLETTFDNENKSASVHAPKLEFAQNKDLIDFQSWWDGQIVVADGMKPVNDPPPRITFTRRQLTLCLANMDGGAHVDPTIDDEYDKLRNQNLMGWFYGGKPLQNPVPATIRQIAYEVLSTFDGIDIAKESRLQ